MSIEAVAWAFKQPITPVAKKFVLVALADNADTYGICFPSHRHIQKKTGLSRGSVINHISALVKEGVIESAARIRGDGSDTSNAYRLPIIEGCIDDHPLSPLFKRGGVQNLYPPVQDLHPPVQNLDGGSAKLVPHEPSFNHQLTKKEKKALTRAEFLREIDRGYQASAFDAFDWLTESEVKIQADACLDFYGAKDEWPAGDPVTVLRHWIRGGVSSGKIRKASTSAPISNKQTAAELEQELSEGWQKVLFKELGADAYKSWIAPLKFDGERLIAPSRFSKDWITTNYQQEIKTAFPDGINFIVGQREEVTA